MREYEYVYGERDGASMMVPGTRVRVRGDVAVGEPPIWPERVGAEGVIVALPEGWGDTYPADSRDRTHVLVLLDDDPLGATQTSHKPGTMLEFQWTARYPKAHLEAL